MNEETGPEIEGCGHQECGRFDSTWKTCLVAGTVLDSSDVTIWVVPKADLTPEPTYHEFVTANLDEKKYDKPAEPRLTRERLDALIVALPYRRIKQRREMTEVQKFRKKPWLVEAQQYWKRVVGLEDNPFAAICRCSDGRGPHPRADSQHVHTLEGPLHVTSGDWIIKGAMGEFYPCKPDIFEATYETVTND